MNNNALHHEMLKQTANCFAAGQTVIAAVSGGADSMAMLHCLTHCGRKLSITVAHLNHQLRGKESDRDEAFVRAYCRVHHLRCVVKRVPIGALSKKQNQSLELCGRKARYAFFRFLCPVGGKIATAHTLSDRVETTLFQMTRGCTLDGLCSIPKTRGAIVRPLLSFTRSEIEAYCRIHYLDFVQDSSNQLQDVSRNRIRHTVIPALKGINAGLEQNMARLLQSVSLDRDYLQMQAQKAYLTAKEESSLNLIYWRTLHPTLQNRVLALFLKAHDVSINQQTVFSLQKLCQTQGRCNIVGNQFAVVRGNLLSIEGPATPTPPFSYHLAKGVEYFFPKLQNLHVKTLEIVEYAEFLKDSTNSFISALDYDKIKGNLILRQRKPKDFLQLQGRPNKSLKKLLNECKIPPPKRDAVGVLSDQEGVLFAQGIGVCARATLQKETKNVLLLLENSS